MAKPVAQIPAGNASFTGKSFLAKGFAKVQYELPVFVVLLLFYLPQKLSVTGDIYSMLHIFDYRIGFAPRLFIGSIMSLFTDYKSQAFMERFFGVVFILEALLFAFAAGRIIRKASAETREISIIFVTLFVAVPYSLAVLYPRLLSLDRFLVIFTLLALIVLSKRGFKWLVPVLLAMGLATYTGFAFTYMPAIALLLLYEVCKNKNSKQSILLCAAGFATMAVFSVFFFLFDGLDKFANVDELIAYAAGKTDLPFVGYYKEVVETLLFKTPGDFFWNSTIPLEGYKGFLHEFTSTIFLLPLIILFFSIWKTSMKAAANKFEKFIFVLCVLAPVARFPMFILSTNFYRGRVSVVVVQFFLLFYFLYTENPAVVTAVKKIGEFFKQNYLLLLLLFAYFSLSFLTFRTGEWWGNFINTVIGK